MMTKESKAARKKEFKEGENYSLTLSYNVAYLELLITTEIEKWGVKPSYDLGTSR